MAFETFLKTIGDLKPEEERDVEKQATGGVRSAAASATTLILGELSARGPTSISAVQKLTGLGFTDFSPALESLLDAGLVEVRGQSGDEIIALAPHVSSATSA